MYCSDSSRYLDRQTAAVLILGFMPPGRVPAGGDTSQNVLHCSADRIVILRR